MTNIPENEVSQEQFLHTISQVTLQKWYSMITLVVNDFSTKVVAPIDSGADQNCIRERIIPSEYCDRRKEQFCSAKGEPLYIKYKLNKGYLQNNAYCFKNIFLIVRNITMM